MDKRTPFHLNPLSFIDSNQIAALAFNFIPIPSAVILYYSSLPAVQYSPLANLEIFKDFTLTLCTFYYYHFNLYAFIFSRIILNFMFDFRPSPALPILYLRGITRKLAITQVIADGLIRKASHKFTQALFLHPES